MQHLPQLPKPPGNRLTTMRAVVALAISFTLILGSGLLAAGFTGSGGTLGYAHWGRGLDVSNRVCGTGPQARLADTAMTFIDGLNSGDFSA